MKKLSLSSFALAAALSLVAASALAGSTNLFSSTKGDIVFPFDTTNIDGMNIGATTPAPGSFTTFKSTDAVQCFSYAQVLTAAIGDFTLAVATRPMILVQASETHAVAQGGTAVVQLTKDTGTDAPGAGTDLLTNTTNTGFNLNATANTPQVGTLVTEATRTFAVGDRLGIDFSTTIGSSSGINITVCFALQ